MELFYVSVCVLALFLIQPVVMDPPPPAAAPAAGAGGPADKCNICMGEKCAGEMDCKAGKLVDVVNGGSEGLKEFVKALGAPAADAFGKPAEAPKCATIVYTVKGKKENFGGCFTEKLGDKPLCESVKALYTVGTIEDCKVCPASLCNEVAKLVDIDTELNGSENTTGFAAPRFANNSFYFLLFAIAALFLMCM